jgi:hypothetical protein
MGMYFLTIRGETRIPGFTNSSLWRSAPHPRAGSPWSLRISARSSAEIAGRPGRDFNRHSRLHPARCQRIMVAGCTYDESTAPLKQLRQHGQADSVGGIHPSPPHTSLPKQCQLAAEE